MERVCRLVTRQTFIYATVSMDIRTVNATVKGTRKMKQGRRGRHLKINYRKCKECGQHISHFEGDVCDYCRGRDR